MTDRNVITQLDLTGSFTLPGTSLTVNRMVAADRNGCCDSNARSRLPGSGVRLAAHTRCSPEPEIAIKREPKGRLPAVMLDVVTQVTFE